MISVVPGSKSYPVPPAVYSNLAPPPQRVLPLLFAASVNPARALWVILRGNRSARPSTLEPSPQENRTRAVLLEAGEEQLTLRNETFYSYLGLLR
jgi:hypothetical protein